MARPKKKPEQSKLEPSTIRPAISPEIREQRMIDLALDRAEQQLRDGTASAQVITHFLKLATEKERLEREKLESEAALKRAQVEAIKAEKESSELYAEAIAAMKLYSGNSEEYDFEYEDEN